MSEPWPNDTPDELLLDCLESYTSYGEDPETPYAVLTTGAHIPETAIIDHLLEMRVSRDEFLRWVAESGYPRPRFWDEKTAEPVAEHAPAPLSTTVAHARQPKKRGRQPTVTDAAIDALRQAIKADPGLRDALSDKTEKELQQLCGNVSRETARKALVTVLRDPK
jgi:hypothetical protein